MIGNAERFVPEAIRRFLHLFVNFFTVLMSQVSLRICKLCRVRQQIMNQTLGSKLPKKEWPSGYIMASLPAVPLVQKRFASRIVRQVTVRRHFKLNAFSKYNF